MGVLTAVYGIGQIAGPPLVALLVALAASHAQGFDDADGRVFIARAGLCHLRRDATPMASVERPGVTDKVSIATESP
jgi:hypothetical protein